MDKELEKKIVDFDFKNYFLLEKKKSENITAYKKRMASISEDEFIDSIRDSVPLNPITQEYLEDLSSYNFEVFYNSHSNLDSLLIKVQKRINELLESENSAFYQEDFNPKKKYSKKEFADLIEYQKKINGYRILKEFENFLNKKKKLLQNYKSETEQKPLSNNKMTYKQFALYIYYLQEAKDIKPFGSSIGIVEEMKAKCNEFGYPSYKYFQSFYNPIRTKKEERINKGNSKNINAVVDLLNDFPNAKKLAIDEMKLASLK